MSSFEATLQEESAAYRRGLEDGKAIGAAEEQERLRSAVPILEVGRLTPEDRETLRRALEDMQHQPLLILPASAHVKPESPPPWMTS